RGAGGGGALPRHRRPARGPPHTAGRERQGPVGRRDPAVGAGARLLRRRRGDRRRRAHRPSRRGGGSRAAQAPRRLRPRTHAHHGRAPARQPRHRRPHRDAEGRPHRLAGVGARGGVMRRELWGLARPYLGWIALSVLAAVVAALAGAGLMAVSGGFIAAMAVSGAAGQEMNYYTPSALVRLFAILRTGARYGERVIGHEATLRIVAEARAWLFARLAPLAPGGLDDLRSGEALARLKTDIDRLETAFLRVAAPLATATIVTLAIATFVALYDARLAGLLLALALAAGVALPLGFLGPLRRAAKARAQLDGERRAALVDTLDGLADLVMAGRFAASAAAAEAMSTRQ